MRLGCCAGLASFVPPTLEGQQDSLSVAHAKQCAKISETIGVMADAGFDYAEFGVGMTCPEQPEDDFQRFLTEARAAPLAAEAFNSFIPAWVTLVGPEVDWTRVEDYVATATERVGRVGATRIIFGSGGARTCPDGWPMDDAREQLLRFIHLAADYCEAHGITLCLEHLNSSETNMMTSLAEATEVAREVDRPSVRVLVDGFHMGMEGESYESIADAGDLIAHAHIADKGRRYPGAFGYDIDGFFAALRRANYDERVSIEANFENFAAEAPLGLSRMQQAARPQAV